MRWAAIGAPMMPSPMKPTLLMTLSSRLSHAGAQRRRRRFPELVAQILAGGTQQAKIAADRHEGWPPFEKAARVGLDRGQNAGRLAGRVRPREDVADGVLHLGMVGIAEMT